MPLSKIQNSSIAANTIQNSSMADNTIHGRRNLIINGAMQCWQRQVAATSIGYTSVDRWSYYAPSSLNIARTTDVPTDFQYSTAVAGGGDSTGITQKIEASTCKQLVGKTVTVSFYLKHLLGHGTDKIAVALSRANSEDNFVSGTTSISSQTVSTTSSYARYTCTFTSLPSEVANGLQLTIKFNGSSSTVYYITGVQLEVGSVTPFEHLSFGETLQLCQRFFHSVNALGHPTPTDAAYARYITFAQDTNATRWFHDFPVTMRATPSLTLDNITSSTVQGFNYVNHASPTLSSTSLSESSRQHAQVIFIWGSGVTRGNTVSWRWNNQPDASFQFNAEL